ncbi:MAG: hypothetical protein ACK5O2_07970 [Microthrixaceae bacterium]
MSNDAEPVESSRHLGRWLILIALAVIAAALGRKMAIDSADREFEARLAALDANRD